MKSNTPHKLPSYKRKWFRTVVAILILLVITLLLMLPKSLSAPDGGIEALVLPDGSEAILYNGASASYKSRDWQNKREIKLDGEAYFTVAKGKTFTVTTPQGSAKVLGTRFKVKSTENFLQVYCYEGLVNVIYKKREFILASMQGITFNGDTDTGVQEVKEPKPLWLKP